MAVTIVELSVAEEVSGESRVADYYTPANGAKK